MTLYTFTTQAVGLLGTFFAFLSFQSKKNKNFYILQALCSVAFFINFIMLRAYTVAVFNILNILRGLIFASGERFHKKIYIIFLITSFTVTSLLTFDGWLTVILLIAQIVSTLTMWSNNGKIIRLGQLCCTSPLWLIYNTVKWSIGGIICETLNISSVLLSFVRFGKDGFEKL